MPQTPPTVRGAAIVQAAESVLVLAAAILAGVDAASGQSYHVNSGIALTAIGVLAAVTLAWIARGLARAGRRTGPEKPVDRLVHRAVAAEGEHQAVPVPGGALRHAGRVPPVACLHNIEVEFGRQRVHDHVPAHLRGRGGEGIDDQERAHVPRVGGRRRNAAEPPDVARGRDCAGG